jgi:hypothetical protein
MNQLGGSFQIFPMLLSEGFDGVELETLFEVLLRFRAALVHNYLVDKNKFSLSLLSEFSVHGHDRLSNFLINTRNTEDSLFDIQGSKPKGIINELCYTIHEARES